MLHHRLVAEMRVVLGIDAAWTLTQPSGVALVAENATGWRLTAVASSYQHFLALADKKQQQAEIRPAGSSPDVPALLNAASALSNRPVDLVAIDMPLAQTPIIGRRNSDNAVSRAYGGRKCGTHTPSPSRPGVISDNLRRDFEIAGYPLRMDDWIGRGLIEVYPHPALLELAGAKERLPYKAAKVRIYWQSASPQQRRENLYRQWTQIIALLESEIAGVTIAFPQIEVTASGRQVKAFEDSLDAVVCAWIGVCALQGRAVAFGDQDSAIWIPAPRIA
jgi:predicted RNase H-like nuclease